MRTSPPASRHWLFSRIIGFACALACTWCGLGVAGVGLAATNTVVVPSGFASVDGHAGTLGLSQVLRIQEAYGAVLFPQRPITIQEIRFRPSTVYGAAFTSTIPDIQITLATTTRQPEGLSSTFADNLGPDAVMAFRGPAAVSSTFNGPAEGPKQFDIALPLTTPFVYDPVAGNLLVEFRIFSPSPTVIGVDATGHGSDLAGRAYSVDPNATVAGAVDVGADIMQFVYSDEPVSAEILVQPCSQEAVVGDPVHFTVSVRGTPPLSYQWRFNGNPLLGETNATLTLPNAQFEQAGGYSMVATNPFGSAVSSIAILTVVPKPTYDLARDFSLAGNPNGVWSYGAKETADGEFSLSTFSATVGGDNGVPVEAWTFRQGVWPGVYHNPSTNTLIANDGAGVYRPGSVWYAAGEDGTARNFGVIRFTVPLSGAGVYRIQTTVRSGLDGAQSQDSDFHVVVNGFEVFGQALPPNAGTVYSNDLALVEGDTLDFMIGRGPDGRLYGSILKIQTALTWLTNTTPRPPAIFVQPRSQEVVAGSAVGFDVRAAGTPPLRYQWQFNGYPLPDETNASLALANAQPDQAGEYAVEVSNEIGSILSATAVLTVSPRPTFDLARDFSIGLNPAGVWSFGAKTTVDGPLSLSSHGVIVMTGPGGPIEAWAYAPGTWPAIYHNAGSDPLITDGGAGFYPPGSVWYAAGEDGTARNFGVARFTVPPGGAAVYRLQTAVRSGLSGSASKDADYHVVLNGVELFGRFLPPNASTSYTNQMTLSDGDTLDFMIGRGADNRLYGSILVIEAALTWVTNAAPQPPVILTQPPDQTVAAGQKAVFRVVAGGTLPLSYQWRFDGAPLDGATNATLELAHVQAAQAGEYSVEVANDLGSVVSANAVLRITERPTFDLAGDFALGSNPNGVWSYGAKSSLGSQMNLASYSAIVDGGSVPIQAWAYRAGTWPAFYRNVGTQTLLTHDGAGVYPPGAVWYAAGDDGTARNFGVIRFTVPAGGAGLYRLQSAVQPGLEGTQGQDSDFHVVLNGTGLFDQFLPPNTRTGFTNNVALLEGDTVDFLIGRGADGKLWGSILKIEATLTWLTNAAPQAPMIVQPPQSVTVEEGQAAGFSVVARGDPPLNYQWHLNGVPLAGATNSFFDLAQAQPSDAGEYMVEVSNTLGSARSAAATLTVNARPVETPPAIVSQPSSRTVLEGEGTTLTLLVTGTEPFSYQWLFNGDDIAGATQPFLSLPHIQLAQAGRYAVRVSNMAGTVTSDEAVLTVQENTSPPVITRQPTSHNVSPGANTTFSVGVTGAPPITYQWQFNELPLPGATNSVLAIASAQEANAGTYFVVVSNAYGFAVSQEAMLTVTNAETDGTVNFANRGSVDAPVFDVDGVTRLTGPDFRAELLAGPTHGTMATVGPAVGFPFPGYFLGGTRSIPTVRAGQSAYVQVRVWDQSQGLSYEEAASNGGKVGASTIFTVVTGGGGVPPSLPANLVGLSSFSLTNGLSGAPLPLVLSPHGQRPDGAREWVLTGPSGTRCVIERSTDLENWSAVTLLRTTNGVARYSEPARSTRAFYRARMAD